MKRLLIATLIVVGAAGPAMAADEELDRVPFFPTVRYGWPERLSVGGAYQPMIPGFLNKLILGGTIGRGGHKLSVGYGAFGGDLMAGTAVHLTLLRTTSDPKNGDPHQTFFGVEGQIMAAAISLKGGPAFRIGGPTSSNDRFRVNFSMGLGF